MIGEYVLNFSLWMFHLIGLHPYKQTLFTKTRFFIFITIFIFIFCLNVLGIIVTYDGVESLAESLDSFPPGHQVLAKLLFAFVLMPKYVSLLKKTESLWPDNIFGNALKEELDKEKRLFEKLFRMYRVTIMSTAFIYTTKPLVLFTKTLPTVWYVPCDTEKLACYVVVVTSQCLWVYLLGMSIVCYDAFFFGILYQAYKELEKIKYGFKNLEINENKEKIDEAQMQKKFASIVEYHNYILEYINDINGIFRLQLLNHFLTVICTICFGIFFLNIDGFPPSHDKLIRYVPYLLSYHFQAYIYCVSGEVLSAQVMSVADAVFDSHWHLNYQPNLTKGICLIMQISQIGKQLSIGDLWDLNLATFGGVIKTSMTFNTFMQTVYNTN